MACYYSFPPQAASESCPVIPHGVRVYGESLGDATAKLARALENDPTLAQPHPEFLSAEEQEPEKKPSSKKAR